MSRTTRILLVPFMGLMGCDGVDVEPRGQSIEAIAEADDDDDDDADEVEQSASDELQAPRETSEATAAVPDALLVSAAAEWRYFIRTSDCNAVPLSTWRTDPVAMLPGTWAPAARAELGYGDGDEVTEIPKGGNGTSNKCITQYFRHDLTLSADDLALYSSYIIRLLRDDGAVVYINGTEVRRDNLQAFPFSIVDGTKALSEVGGDDEDEFKESAPSALPLIAGVNFIAVEVHQASASNPDVSFNFELTGVLKVSPPVTGRQTSVIRSTEATIEQGHPDAEFGESSRCKVDGASDDNNVGADQVCLVQWDFADADILIPATAKIRAAQIVGDVENDTPDRYEVYPIVLPTGISWAEDVVTWNDPNGITAGDWSVDPSFGVNTLDDPISLVYNAFDEGNLLIPLPAATVAGWLGTPAPDAADGVAIFNTKNRNGVDFNASGLGLKLVVTWDP